jgi:2OG-Fe(II) oxygenase superfamily
MVITPLDREALRREYRKASPFPFVKIENFLHLGFATKVAGAYPSFDGATAQGRTFRAVNERKKVQITDATRFAEPVAELNNALASATFLSDLSYVTDIPDLVADEQLIGGGMHITGPGGRLDVHVDFNYIQSRKLHRRLNLLLYLNPRWDEKWGGQIQLWDQDVKNCQQAFAPLFNRCIIFETSEISFHGVTPVTKAAPFPRISFATYYYTHQPPPNWTGRVHSTIFKARPEEHLRRYVLMPAEIVQRRLMKGVSLLKRGAKRLVNSANG